MEFDPERAALILSDAMVLGDKPAARKWTISERSIQRYRARMRTDAALSARVAENNAGIQRDLATLRVAFLRDALSEMRAKLKDASLYEVSGAVKIVGELHQVAGVLDDERPDSPDPEASQNEGGGVEQTSVSH